MTIDASVIAKLTRRVTKKHATQIKAEERRVRSRWSRAYTYSDRVNFTDVVARILPEAYRAASGDGRLPASQRQVYYAAREAFRKATGREITQQRCNTLLLQYMNQRPGGTAAWRVTADPRGTLLIPNTFQETRIPCGTIAIDQHLAELDDDEPLDGHVPLVPKQWPSLAGGQRFRAVLYIEKEGFEPLLRSTRIAERYEIAVLSCKGQSVVAARKYVDHVCRVNGGVPLFVVHDFDVFGFFIGARLTSVSWQAEEQDRVAYRFQNDIDVLDFGLRLKDVEKYGLAAELCKPPKHIRSELECTDEERAFLYSGRRVELNAFTAPQFVEWLENNLKAAGLEGRLTPSDVIVERAYRRGIVTARLNEAIRRVHADAVSEAVAAKLPKRLKSRLAELMAARDETWDLALYRLACDELGIQETSPAHDDRDANDPAVAALDVLSTFGITGLPADLLRRSAELAVYSQAEIDAVLEGIRRDRVEATHDDMVRRLRANRRKAGRRPRSGKTDNKQ